MTGQAPSTEALDVRRRLREYARANGIDLQQAVLYYAMERFLYRLSRTAWADRLVVKGATMLRVWGATVTRPTRDIDFLGRLDNSPDGIRAVVLECLSVSSADGIIFADQVEVEQITVADRYPGVRAKIRGHLAGVRFMLRLDIGIDDAVVPDPGWCFYPAMLGGESPRILAYQPPTAVAEKFEAMVDLGLANSRMKDFYDIWMLAGTLEFDGQELAEAMKATFTKRGTPLPRVLPPAITGEFGGQPTTTAMWRAYQQTLRVGGIDAPESLEEVIDVISSFLAPGCAAAASNSQLSMVWVPGEGWIERI